MEKSTKLTKLKENQLKLRLNNCFNIQYLKYIGKEQTDKLKKLIKNKYYPLCEISSNLFAHLVVDHTPISLVDFTVQINIKDFSEANLSLNVISQLKSGKTIGYLKEFDEDKDGEYFIIDFALIDIAFKNPGASIKLNRLELKLSNFINVENLINKKCEVIPLTCKLYNSLVQENKYILTVEIRKELDPYYPIEHIFLANSDLITFEPNLKQKIYKGEIITGKFVKMLNGSNGLNDNPSSTCTLVYQF